MPNAAMLGQTIQVVDRSGKVVSSSRHLVDIFRIGRDAYSSKKREINSKKAPSSDQARSERRPPGRAYTIDDASSARSGRSHRSHHSSHTRRGPNPAESPRSGPDGNIPAGTPFYEAFPEMAVPRRHSTHHASRSHGPPAAPSAYYAPPQEQPLVRRSTTRDDTRRRHSAAQAGIDLDLAYGQIPPDCLYPGSPSVASTPQQDEAQLRGLVGKLNGLLDEAQCLRGSATAIIAHLQNKPDAMAAVGLTLAEISNLVKKMGPGVLTSLKAAAPSIFGLLSHPQFLIAAGVATGVTIIAFGGYKIVQKLQERKEMEAVGDEGMLAVEDVSRIETWRRGIADVEAASDGTSVEGEFITPLARDMSRMNLAEERSEHRLARERPAGMERRVSSPKTRAPRSDAGSSRSTRRRSMSEPAARPKIRTSSASKSGKKPSDATSSKHRKVKVAKEAKPSPLRRLLLV